MIDATGDWQLTELLVGGAPVALVEDSPVTMTVSGARIGGTSACNGYGAELVVVDGQVRFGEWSSTMMLCEDAVMVVEGSFTQAMAQVRTAAREGDDLVLRGDGVELRFTPLAPPPTEAIVGTTWRLESLIEGETASSPAGDPATLVLHADGRYEGSTGCRSFTGRWIEAEGRYVATELAMDQTECPPDLQAQDSHVTGVVGEFRATVEGDTLTITARGGSTLVYRAGD
jgi:heat shock protein HslJ